MIEWSGPFFLRLCLTWVLALHLSVGSSSFTRIFKASAILVNGYISRSFKPFRGVRQGCPLSPLLYVLTMEVLAANIRAHPSIVGLSVPRSPQPLPVLSLYADDTSVIVTSDAAIPLFYTCWFLKFCPLRSENIKKLKASSSPDFPVRR